MVKKATAKKSGKNPGGRPPRDPDTLRTERLVLRIHPDLMRCLTALANDSGLTRSMLVERALVSFVNLSAGNPIIDSMGRLLHAGERQGHALGTTESFEQIWRGVAAAPTVTPRPGGFPRWVPPARVQYPPDYSPDDGPDNDEQNYPSTPPPKWRKK